MMILIVKMKVVCKLLEHGADLSVTDAHGSTPFIVAVKHGLGELVTLLIDRGASKDDFSKVFFLSFFH